MGASIITATSRQAWAFARDNGLPFSSIIKVVNSKLKVPIRAIIFSGTLALIIGLLCLINDTAANAVFTLTVCGNYFAWQSPIILRMYRQWSKDESVRFKPGPFYLGDILSPIVNILSIFFTVFVIIMAMFPSEPTVDKETMNYTIVITGGTWILSMAYYYAYAHKTFKGPRSTVEGTPTIEGTGEDTDKIDAAFYSAEKESI